MPRRRRAAAPGPCLNRTSTGASSVGRRRQRSTTALTLLLVRLRHLQRRGAGLITAVLSAPWPRRRCADLPQEDSGVLRCPCRRTEPAPHCSADRAPRCDAGSTGIDLLGRRRRPRRDRHHPALSAIADGAHRRLRHRPRRDADPRRRHRPLGTGFDRLASPRLTRRRFAAGHRHRQLHIGARAERSCGFRADIAVGRTLCQRQQPRGRLAGLPERPLANRPPRSRAPCSPCFIWSRSGIANSIP